MGYSKHTSQIGLLDPGNHSNGVDISNSTTGEDKDTFFTLKELFV